MDELSFGIHKPITFCFSTTQHGSVRDSSRLVSYLQKLAPKIQELESSLHHDVPIRNGHVQIESLLALVLRIVERVLIEILELAQVHQIVLHGGQLGDQLIQTVDAQLQESIDELGAREFALGFRFESPRNDEHHLRFGTQSEIFEEANDTVQADFVRVVGVTVVDEQLLYLFAVQLSAVLVARLEVIVAGQVELPLVEIEAIDGDLLGGLRQGNEPSHFLLVSGF